MRRSSVDAPLPPSSFVVVKWSARGDVVGDGKTRLEKKKKKHKNEKTNSKRKGFYFYFFWVENYESMIF